MILVLVMFFVHPFSALVSGNYFTAKPRAERLCAGDQGVETVGPEFVVCKNHKVYKLWGDK
jgi:hypothetical protein